jgi:hypothetical protein
MRARSGKQLVRGEANCELRIFDIKQKQDNNEGSAPVSAEKQLTKTIPLTQGKVTLVDGDDYEELSKYKWCVQRGANTFYAQRKARANGEQTAILMHRQILGFPPEIDHINRDGLDNRRCNLRVVTHRQNAENRRGQSLYGVGVYIDPTNKVRPFRALALINGRLKHLGLFPTASEARLARARFLEGLGAAA